MTPHDTNARDSAASNEAGAPEITPEMVDRFREILRRNDPNAFIDPDAVGGRSAIDGEFNLADIIRDLLALRP